ncbi:MAG: hypothetical protein KKB37_04695 [Alphaproteobacteria bacterium]|nr:hypothetical protein [Alphaproteobacteria bacterium]
MNIEQVLERTVQTLVEFDAYLRRYDYNEIDDPMLAQFNTTIQHDLNAEPAFHTTPILTRMNKDTSISGYGDVNADGAVGEKEPRLFKIEFDGDNNRIIVTAAAHGNATGSFMPRTGFFSGAMIGALLSRQMNAGIKPGYFHSRQVAGAALGDKVASNTGSAENKKGSAARSKARSGGVRAGK